MLRMSMYTSVFTSFFPSRPGKPWVCSSCGLAPKSIIVSAMTRALRFCKCLPELAFTSFRVSLNCDRAIEDVGDLCQILANGLCHLRFSENSCGLVLRGPWLKVQGAKQCDVPSSMIYANVSALLDH